MQAVRIKAEVHVVHFQMGDLEDFTTDWTVRRRRTEVVTQKQQNLADMFEAPRQEPEAPAAPHTNGNGSQRGPIRPLHITAQPATGEAEYQRQVKIRQAIVEHSAEAAVVLVNLPPPPKTAWNHPLMYFKLVDCLTADLPRVVFVYGSGTEVLSQYI